MDRGGNVVLAGKLRLGDLDLLEPDAAHALANRLLQFEPIGHASTNSAAGQPGSSLRPPISSNTRATVTIHRAWLVATQRASLVPTSQARERSAQASHWRTRASGSACVKKSVITARLSAPAASTPSALSGVMPPIATKGRRADRFFQRRDAVEPLRRPFHDLQPCLVDGPERDVARRRGERGRQLRLRCGC